MYVAVQGGVEAVEQRDGAEPGLRGARCVLVARHTGRVAEESLDLGEEDRGERRDGLGAIGQETAQPLTIRKRRVLSSSISNQYAHDAALRERGLAALINMGVSPGITNFLIGDQICRISSEHRKELEIESIDLYLLEDIDADAVIFSWAPARIWPAYCRDRGSTRCSAI
jgi:hypothetical protein